MCSVYNKLFISTNECELSEQPPDFHELLMQANDTLLMTFLNVQIINYFHKTTIGIKRGPELFREISDADPDLDLLLARQAYNERTCRATITAAVLVLVLQFTVTAVAVHVRALTFNVFFASRALR